LPFAAGTFDEVMCANVLLYFPEEPVWQSMVSEMLRLLAPGGVLRITNGPHFQALQAFVAKAHPDVRCEGRGRKPFIPGDFNVALLTRSAG
jgi:chemotaxis methyl-accepting protein methylase